MSGRGTVFDPAVGSVAGRAKQQCHSNMQTAPCAGCTELHPALKCGFATVHVCVCVLSLTRSFAREGRVLTRLDSQNAVMLS